MTQNYFQFQGLVESYPSIKVDTEVGAWQQAAQIPYPPFVVAAIVASTAFVPNIFPAVVPIIPITDVITSVEDRSTTLFASGGVLTDFSTVPLEAGAWAKQADVPYSPGYTEYLHAQTVFTDFSEVPLEPGAWAKQADVPYFPDYSEHLISSGGIIVPVVAQVVDPSTFAGSFAKLADVPYFPGYTEYLEGKTIWVDPTGRIETPQPAAWAKQADIPYLPGYIEYLIASGGVWTDPTPTVVDVRLVEVSPAPQFDVSQTYLYPDSTGDIIVLGPIFMQAVDGEWVIRGDDTWEIQDDREWKIDGQDEWSIE